MNITVPAFQTCSTGMDMARAAGIDARHDAAQTVAPVGIRELVTAQAETGIVVLAFGVGLPEIQ